MAKAKVNFYWNGKLIEAGKEAPEDAPKSLLVDESKEDKPKRKNGRPKTTSSMVDFKNKNAAPNNLEDK